MLIPQLAYRTNTQGEECNDSISSTIRVKKKTTKISANDSRPICLHLHASQRVKPLLVIAAGIADLKLGLRAEIYKQK